MPKITRRSLLQGAGALGFFMVVNPGDAVAVATEELPPPPAGKVAITAHDAKECRKFFEYFDIPMRDELKSAFDTFCSDPSFRNQEELKFWLADAIALSEHRVFKDEVFAQVRPETKKVHEALVKRRAKYGY